MTISLMLCYIYMLYPRRSARTVFKTANYEGSLYKRSPYFVGSKLWDSLSHHDIELPDIYAFKARLKSHNRDYRDLLS